MFDAENCERFEDAMKILYDAIEALEPVMETVCIS